MSRLLASHRVEVEVSTPVENQQTVEVWVRDVETRNDALDWIAALDGNGGGA